jgi:hypothetical protein
MIRLKILAMSILILITSGFGWIRVTKATTDERQSSVAWLNNQYLVCWADDRDWAIDSSTSIRGARISTNGIVIDTNSFLIDGGYPDRLTPEMCAGNSDWIIAFQEGC